MSESAFGVEHGEFSKSLGLPKGMLKAKGKGEGGLATSYIGNRKMAKYTGKILSRIDAQKGGTGGNGVFPHVGERYRNKSREILATRNTKKPGRKLP